MKTKKNSTFKLEINLDELRVLDLLCTNGVSSLPLDFLDCARVLRDKVYSKRRKCDPSFIL